MRNIFILSVLGILTTACVSTPKKKKTDIVVFNFKGPGGEVIRNAIESRIGKIKIFRVISRDAASMAEVKGEAVKDKNADDMFMKEGSGVKLKEGLAGAKVLHGTCFKNADRGDKKALGGLLVWKGEQVTQHSLYCNYRLINAQDHVQEMAGDTEPKEYTSQKDKDDVVDNKVVREIADEVIENITKHIEEDQE